MKTNNLVLLTAFALALTLSAGLLFNIQPMIGKMLLPLVGGAPAVWNVAMAFFQISLLTGYLVAHLLGKLPPLGHALGYAALLGLAALLLPITLPAGWQPDPALGPALSVFKVLVISVALPFIALSLSAPTLQRLFAATTHPEATDPYFLYAASNLGSFAGLLLYPLWLESNYAIPAQTGLWRLGYFALMAVALLCILLQHANKSAPVTKSEAVSTRTKITSKTIALWVLLAFIPSSLTLGVTTHITTDIAATPMLWAVTLALYLLTFILAFAQTGAGLRKAALVAAPWLAGLGLALTMAPLHMVLTELGLHLLVFAAVALACHSRLAATRPDASHLTAFYLWLSVGGALGGAFNAFLAPVVFDRLLEYPFVLLAALVLLPVGRTDRNRLFILGILAAAALSYGQGALVNHVTTLTDNRTIALFVLGTMLFISQIGNRWLMACLGLALVFLKVSVSGDVVFSDRDFFGTVSVREDNFSYVSPEGIPATIKIRALDHGTTRHSVQLVDGPTPPIPTFYYSPLSPIAAIIKAVAPNTVIVTGLGAGGLNCFMAPGRHFTFIEIDPLMEQVAREHFDFLSQCTPPTVIIGDGRLKMLEQPEGAFDLIILDAFASDSIPTHLVTQEALAIYLKRLRPGGAMAIHISNRFFNLEPMLAALTKNLGLYARFGESMAMGATREAVFLPTRWVVVAQDEAIITRIESQNPMWRKLQENPAIKAWTDEYSNLLAVMKWHNDAIAIPLPNPTEAR